MLMRRTSAASVSLGCSCSVYMCCIIFTCANCNVARWLSSCQWQHLRTGCAPPSCCASTFLHTVVVRSVVLTHCSLTPAAVVEFRSRLCAAPIWHSSNSSRVDSDGSKRQRPSPVTLTQPTWASQVDSACKGIRQRCVPAATYSLCHRRAVR